MGRGFLSAVATGLATAAMLATLLALYANHVLVNSAAFSDRAVSVVRSSEVESLIVRAVTDRVVADIGDEASLQPLIDRAVRTTLATGQVTADVRVAAGLLHGELMSGTANSLTLTLPDAGSSIASAIGSNNPELAAALRDVGSITVVDVRIPSTYARVLHDVTRAARNSSLLLVITVALLALALIISPNRTRTLRGLGLGALFAGLLVALTCLVGRGIVVDRFSTQDARLAARAAWGAYLGGLKTWGFVLAGIGLAVAGVASLSLSRAPVR